LTSLCGISACLVSLEINFLIPIPVATLLRIKGTAII